MSAGTIERVRAAATTSWPLGTDASPRARGATVLIVLVWACVVGPQVVQSLTAPKVWRPITEGGVSLSAAAQTATTLGNGVLVLACGAVVVIRWRSLSTRGLGALTVVAAAWLWCVAGLVLAGDTPGAPVLIVPAVAVGLWVARPGPAHIEVLGWLTAVTATSSLVLGLIAPDAGIYTRAAAVAGEKPVSGFGILAGILPTGNTLGLALALGLPAVLFIRRGWLRWSSLAITVVALVLTASRASYLAAGIMAIAALAIVVVRRRAVFAAAWLAVLALASVLIPVLVTSGTAFTNRGGYWIFALDAWREQPWTGHGANFFKNVANSATNLGGHASDAHNQVVQLLVTGGVLLGVLVAVLVVLAGVKAVRAAAGGFAWPTLFLTGLFVVSLFEVTIGFVDRIALIPFALLPALVLVLGEFPSRGHAKPVDRGTIVT